MPYYDLQKFASPSPSKPASLGAASCMLSPVLLAGCGFWSWVTVLHQEAELVALAILRIRDVAIAALDGARSVIQQQRGGFRRPSNFLILASIQRELRLLMRLLIPDSLILTRLRSFARVR